MLPLISNGPLERTNCASPTTARLQSVCSFSRSSTASARAKRAWGTAPQPRRLRPRTITPLRTNELSSEGDLPFLSTLETFEEFNINRRNLQTVNANTDTISQTEVGEFMPSTE